MSSVMGKFVHATFVPGTFLHIRNILAVTFRSNFFGPNFVGAKFLSSKSFWTQYFLIQNLLEPKFFWTKIFFDQNFFEAKFFWTKSFWTQIVCKYLHNESLKLKFRRLWRLTKNILVKIRACTHAHKA